MIRGVTNLLDTLFFVTYLNIVVQTGIRVQDVCCLCPFPIQMCHIWEQHCHWNLQLLGIKFHPKSKEDKGSCCRQLSGSERWACSADHLTFTSFENCWIFELSKKVNFIWRSFRNIAGSKLSCTLIGNTTLIVSLYRTKQVQHIVCCSINSVMMSNRHFYVNSPIF